MTRKMLHFLVFSHFAPFTSIHKRLARWCPLVFLYVFGKMRGIGSGQAALKLALEKLPQNSSQQTCCENSTVSKLVRISHKYITKELLIQTQCTLVEDASVFISFLLKCAPLFTPAVSHMWLNLLVCQHILRRDFHNFANGQLKAAPTTIHRLTRGPGAMWAL